MFHFPSISVRLKILSGYICYEFFFLAAGPKYSDSVYKLLIMISQPNWSLELHRQLGLIRFLVVCLIIDKS